MLSRIERLDKPTEVASEMRITLEPNVLSGEDVLTIEGLSKSFGDNNLFSGIDMDIKRGEHVAPDRWKWNRKDNHTEDDQQACIQRCRSYHTWITRQDWLLRSEHQVLTMSNTIFDEISDATLICPTPESVMSLRHSSSQVRTCSRGYRICQVASVDVCPLPN